jgi:phytoene dehydrogenase-like protein
MHAASAYAYAFPVEAPRGEHGRLKNEMAERVIDKICRYAPNFRDIRRRHITFAPYHMNTMFGAPDGDFCHGLLHPDLMGSNRLWPKGFRDLPIGFDGLYLGGAGCLGDQASPSFRATTPGIRCSMTSTLIPHRWRASGSSVKSVKSRQSREMTCHDATVPVETGIST